MQLFPTGKPTPGAGASAHHRQVSRSRDSAPSRVASPLHCEAAMDTTAHIARSIVSRRWFAPVLWFAIAFLTAALTTG